MTHTLATKPELICRLMATFFAVIVLPLSLGACSQLYLHYDGYEKTTAEVKADVDKIDVASAFTTLATDADDLAKREEEALAGSLINRRDHFLVKVIDPLPGDWLEPGIHVREQLQYLADEQFALIVPDRQSIADESRNYVFGFGTLSGLLKELDGAVANAGHKARQYSIQYAAGVAQKIGEQPNSQAEPIVFNCAVALSKYPNADPSGISLVAIAGNALEAAYEDLARTCKYRQDVEKKFNAYLCVLAFAGVDCTSDTSDIEKLLPHSRSGTIARAALELLLATDSIRKNEAEAQQTQIEAAALAKKLGVGDANADLLKALKDFDDKLKMVGALAKLTGLEQIQSFLECGFVADINAAAAEAGKAEDDASDVAAAATATTNTADACKSGAASAKEEGKEGKVGGGVSLALKTILQLQADAAAIERLERIDANLLALSALKLRHDLAAAQVDLDQTKLTLFKGRLLALLKQYGDLHGMEAVIKTIPEAKLRLTAADMKVLDSEKGGPALAFTKYASSWNYGAIPAQLIQLRFLQAERRYRIQVATINAANYKATIQPIADALATYGSGGITPEMIVQWLQFLGIIKIAAGA